MSTISEISTNVPTISESSTNVPTCASQDCESQKNLMSSDSDTPEQSDMSVTTSEQMSVTNISVKLEKLAMARIHRAVTVIQDWWSIVHIPYSATPARWNARERAHYEQYGEFMKLSPVKRERPEEPFRRVEEVESGEVKDFDPERCAARVWMFQKALSKHGDKDLPEQGEIRQCNCKRVGGEYCRSHSKKAIVSEEGTWKLRSGEGFKNQRLGLYTGRYDKPFEPIRWDAESERWIMLWNTPGELFQDSVTKWLSERDTDSVTLYCPFSGGNGRFEVGVKEFLLAKNIKLMSWETLKQPAKQIKH